MKALVADGDSDVRAFIEFTLRQGGFDVRGAASGAATLAAFEEEPPRLLLLDANVPEIDGLELCREIRRRSNVPIMVLTRQDREDDIVAAFDSGADDCVRKPFSPRTLLARARALVRRAEPLHAPTLEIGRAQLDMEQHLFRIGPTHEIYVTPLELKALHLMMSSAGRTVSAERMMMHVWNRSTARERRTLKQLIYRLRHKLEADPAAPQILLTTPGSGYKLNLDQGDSRG